MRVRQFVSTLALGAIGVAGSAAAWQDSWTQSGNDINNSRHQPGETRLGPHNVGNLAPAWIKETAADVSATPAVDDGYIYFGDWAGNLYKLNVNDGAGAPNWPVTPPTVGDYTGVTGDFSRNTLTIADGDLVLFGNQAGRFFLGGAKLVAVDKNDASPAWVTALDSHPASIATSSPTLHAGTAFIGVASFEEGFAAFIPKYDCCTFRGSVVAVDVATGEVLWRTYMAPEGFSGNAVWGSSPAVDVLRNQIYVATGNNYSAPQSYHDCVASAKNEKQQKGCNPNGNYFDSIVALNMTTGEVNWVKRVLPYDTWNVACAADLVPEFPEENAVNCDFGDNEAGPDFDFGQGPILYSVGPGRGGDRVGVGQKSGVYWSLKPSNGDVLWSTRTGPGGLAGGHQWGSASDGERIYTSNANSFGAFIPPWPLPDGSETQAGIFSALDATTGDILWQIANPAGEPAGSPASVANGVMYVCSMGGLIGTAPNLGQMYAIDASNGDVLWEFASGSSCGGGASIVDGMVFWGTGYTSIGGVPGNELFAFTLP